eukprot:1313107-Pleurochrysis_carterae.AAC.1
MEIAELPHPTKRMLVSSPPRPDAFDRSASVGVGVGIIGDGGDHNGREKKWHSGAFTAHIGPASRIVTLAKGVHPN